MFTRSKNIIERDYNRLMNIKPWGIEVLPLEDGHFYEWTVLIHGLKNTDWEGGIFRLCIKFTEGYNDEPPEVCFHSIPFHPNIDAVNGYPNIDILKNPKKWNPSYDTFHILSTVQNLLSYPKLDDADVLNADAANMYLYYPLNYRQTVQQCVSASQKIHLTELNIEQDLVYTRQRLYDDTPSRLAPPSPRLSSASPDTSQRIQTSGATVRRQCRIPFEEYYRMWSNIATSTNDGRGKFDSKQSNARVNDSNGQPGSAEQSKSRYTSSFLQQDPATKRKLDHVRRMRDVYMKRPPTTPQQLISSRSQTTEHGHHETSISSRSHKFDEEVDDLISWTDRLDV